MKKFIIVLFLGLLTSCQNREVTESFCRDLTTGRPCGQENIQEKPKQPEKKENAELKKRLEEIRKFLDQTAVRVRKYEECASESDDHDTTCALYYF